MMLLICVCSVLLLLIQIPMMDKLVILNVCFVILQLYIRKYRHYQSYKGKKWAAVSSSWRARMCCLWQIWRIHMWWGGFCYFWSLYTCSIPTNNLSNYIWFVLFVLQTDDDICSLDCKAELLKNLKFSQVLVYYLFLLPFISKLFIHKWHFNIFCRALKATEV